MTCACCGNADAATEPTARDAALCWECRGDFVDLSHGLSGSDWDEDRVDTEACAALLQQVRLSVFERPAVMKADPLASVFLNDTKRIVGGRAGQRLSDEIAGFR